jgi:integrase
MAKIYRRYVVDPKTKKRVLGKVWWVSYQENGLQKQRSLQVTDQRIAEMMKADIEKSIERGRAGLPQSHTDAHNVFVEFRDSVIKKKSPGYGKRMFQLLKPFWAFLQKKRLTNLVNVTVHDVEQHLEARHKKLADKTWNDELGVINQFFRFAVDRDYLARNPAAKIQKRRVVRHSIEIFTPTEIELIFKYADKGSTDFYRVLLLTGLRLGEARYLQWADVDLTPGQDHIKVRSTAVHQTKTRRDRVVPLCDEAVELFKRLQHSRKASNPFVFPGRKGGPRGENRNTWVDCLRRIERDTGVKIDKGYHRTGLHLFRHTFASYAVAAGISVRVVQQWLGHSTILMTERYTNLLPNQLHDPISRLNFGIEAPPTRGKGGGK